MPRTGTRSGWKQVANMMIFKIQHRQGGGRGRRSHLACSILAAGLLAGCNYHNGQTAYESGSPEEAAQQWTARFNPRPVGEGEILGLFDAAL